MGSSLTLVELFTGLFIPSPWRRIRLPFLNDVILLTSFGQLNGSRSDMSHFQAGDLRAVFSFFLCQSMSQTAAVPAAWVPERRDVEQSSVLAAVDLQDE